MISQADHFKILIVDDETENIWPLIEELEKEFEILCATDGQEALNIASSKPLPDLILLDIMMPGMDGYEILSRLKADEATRKIPVIFVTAKNKNVEEVKGIELGAQDYITKPFSMPTVRARIKNVLNLKKEEDRRVLLQEQLEEMNEHLKHQVQDKLKELTDAKKALQNYENKYNQLFQKDQSENKIQTILIVDDIPENIQILIENLESQYEIICVTNGEDALEIAFSKNKPDLILLDIMMPGMDGYEVCSRLKANSDTWDLPVIFITALGQEVDETKGLNLGGVDFVTKPFSIPVIQARIKAVLRLKQEMHSRIVLTRKLADLNKNLEHRIEKKTIELQDTHEKLKSSEKKFRSIYQNAIEGIYQSTPDGRLVNASPSLARMLGYESSLEMIHTIANLSQQLYFCPDDRKRLIRELEKKGEVSSFEARFRKKNGDSIWGMLYAKTIQEDTCDDLYYQGFFVDITERKNTEKALEQLRNQIQNIIDYMPSILVGVDLEGRVIHWNHEAEMTTGLTIEKVRGNKLEKVFPRFAGEMERVQKAIQECRTQKDTKVLSEIDGEIRYSDIIVYPLIPDQCEGAVIRIDDVTDQIRMEEIMIQSEKMLSLGGLAAGMAHEINNPLSGIIQYSQVIKNRLAKALPKNLQTAEECKTSIDAIRSYMEKRDVLSMFDTIVDLGKRATNIIDNMLSFARKNETVFSNHDLSALIDHTITLAQMDYNSKKKYDFRQIKIIQEFDKDLPCIPCDDSKIQQVFFNILKNGAQAMAGQDSENRNQENIFILRLIKEDNMARIEIEDNGPGMDETTKKKVFEPFFTTKGKDMGTGLGMSISHFIIAENHGGEMTVESTLGFGAKFIIRLPLGQ